MIEIFPRVAPFSYRRFSRDDFPNGGQEYLRPASIVKCPGSIVGRNLARFRGVREKKLYAVLANWLDFKQTNALTVERSESLDESYDADRGNKTSSSFYGCPPNTGYFFAFFSKWRAFKGFRTVVCEYFNISLFSKRTASRYRGDMYPWTSLERCRVTESNLQISHRVEQINYARVGYFVVPLATVKLHEDKFRVNFIRNKFLQFLEIFLHRINSVSYFSFLRYLS